MDNFSKIAPYLNNPLVLTGFGLLLFFGVHRALIKSGILPPVSQTASSKIVRLLLHYGFLIALLVLLAGFGLSAWNSYLKTKGKLLTRVEAETLIQKNRGNIEFCLKNNPEILFLNFLFAYSDQGGINMDVLGGRELRGAMLPHTRVPAGVYDYDGLRKAIEVSEYHAPLSPKQPEDDQLTYFVQGNTFDENPWDEHASVLIAESGARLSASVPAVIGCIVGVLQDPLKGFVGLQDNKSFLHRYVTDSGAAKSSVRPSLLDQMDKSPFDNMLAGHLATVYRDGVDGPKDAQKAYQWFVIAESIVEHGEHDLVEKDELKTMNGELTAVAANLTAEQIDTAKRSAEQWLAEHKK